MPQPKESTFAGRKQQGKTLNLVFCLLGILGALLILLSYSKLYPSRPLFVSGSLLLLATAIYYRLFFFMALETILLANQLAILLHIGPIQQLILPICLTAQLLIYYSLSGELKNIFYLLGISSIALLSIGFAFNNGLVFFLGNVGILAFSLYCIRKGQAIAWIWFVLNLIFMIVYLNGLVPA